MLKRNNLFIGVALVTSLLLAGCSQSDGYSTSTNDPVEVIHGYTLPPKPDQTINNSTLLGIDSNDNGVRDDVEIWILKKYKDEHPIYIEIAMQAGRAWQKVLEDPSKAKEVYPIVDAATWCEGYYLMYAKENNQTININKSINNKSFRENIIFNTDDRLKAFWEYDALLSGESYTIPWNTELKAYCDFNTSKYTTK